MTGARAGSICSGYGGLDMAVTEAGVRAAPVWHADTDPGAARVLAHHWPRTPNLGDITAVDWTQVEPIDVLTGGWPCQPFSHAGLRAGAGDDRHLWPTGVLPAVAALRPVLVVGENVPGLLTIEAGRVFGRILADLTGLGYAVSWATVGACVVGACHCRHRVFIAATLADAGLPVSDPVAHWSAGGWVPVQQVLFGDAGALAWPRAGFVSRSGVVWESPSTVCGLAGGLPTPRMSDANGSGVHGDGGLDLRTAVTLLPTPTARDAKRGAGWGDRPGRPLSEVAAMLPTPRASDATKGGPNQRGSAGDVALPAAVQPARFGRYASAVTRHEKTFGRPAPDPTEPGRTGTPRLTAAFTEWMMGLPAGHLTDVLDRRSAIHAAGNGVVPAQGAHALQHLPTFRAAAARLRAGAAS